MKKYESYARVLPWFMALFLSVLVAACGGGRDPILGVGGIGAFVPPTVTAVTPGINAVAVSINNPVITATFSEPVAPITGGASFTVTCAAPCVSPTGTVSLDATGKIAAFTLTPATSLVALTTYTATVTGATSVATGLALATPKVWQFTTTGAALDTTRPTVLTTDPVKTTTGPTTGVPTNAAITAVFSEDMAAATIVIPATSFTLACATCATPAPTGSVSYKNKVATFTPTAVLEASKTYTATIKGTGANPVTDVLGNALAGNPASPAAANDYVWLFTTAANPAPVGNPKVNLLTTSPTASATGVCPSASINATFTVPSGLRMDPSTINAINFVVTGPAATPVVATSVLLDGATGRIATFTPSVPLTNGVTYTATMKG
ncbi:MAG TPA: Ig-like domain-containing protein, partial [Rhodoferax sp.]